MHDYGVWTVITPLITIILAILTRQVVLSLLTGIFVGYVVIHNSLIQGVIGTLNGIIETFSSAGNTRTVVFMVMIGGIMRLIVSPVESGNWYSTFQKKMTLLLIRNLFSYWRCW